MKTQAKLTKLELEPTEPIKYVAEKFAGTWSLRRSLLFSIVPAVLVPLIIASSIGYNLTSRRAKSKVLERIETHSFLGSKTINTFIRDSFKVINLVAVNPEMIQAMKAGIKEAEAQQLTKQPIPELEKKFARSKSLIIDNTLNQYLQRIVQSGQFAEIFATERNGFNVALSNPTTDFVQSDEDWWQGSRKEGIDIGEAEFDDSANANIIALSQAVKDPQTDAFLGVIKAGMPMTTLVSELVSATYPHGTATEFSYFQVINSRNGRLFISINHINDEARVITDQGKITMEVIGGDPIKNVAEIIVEVAENSLSLDAAKQRIAQESEFSNITIKPVRIISHKSVIALFKYQNKIYSLSTVPKTDLVSINIIDYGAVFNSGRDLLRIFAVTTIVLSVVASGVILVMSKQITKPIADLSVVTQEAARGNLDVAANIDGTLETKILANNFNNLVNQIKESLRKQQALTEEQRQEKEELEKAIYTLIDEVSDATEGNLTVRANLNSLELSTVADLFNAIIDSLQYIAIEAKNSTSQVAYSLQQNQSAILSLAEQAISEAEETRNMLVFVEEMSESIQAVAKNAGQAEKIADDTHNLIFNSTNNMDLTVESIIDLRKTIGETAKKMKRLGESSQKISQVVSFIEEIALKTNVLAINATVEAGRAGEYGEGFTIVAEQVGALAEQSAAATKEIANIVSTIQGETLEVSQAMESGITQVVESTRLVEYTKQSLGLVLEKYQEINQLMGSISQTTVSQANTSQNVTYLMQTIAQLSETTSMSSREVAQSILETAQVAKKLESAVAKFKVTND